jgi:hypothetical protein
LHRIHVLEYVGTAFIAANYMGPSGIYRSIFISRMAISWNYLPSENDGGVDIFLLI